MKKEQNSIFQNYLNNSFENNVLTDKIVTFI